MASPSKSRNSLARASLKSNLARRQSKGHGCQNGNDTNPLEQVKTTDSVSSMSARGQAAWATVKARVRWPPLPEIWRRRSLGKAKDAGADGEKEGSFCDSLIGLMQHTETLDRQVSQVRKKEDSTSSKSTNSSETESAQINNEKKAEPEDQDKDAERLTNQIDGNVYSHQG